MKINSRGYWENPTAEGHGHDEGLAKALVEFLEDNRDGIMTIWDVGCGDGYYTKYINEYGNFLCFGLDGNPNTESIAGEDCEIVDLSLPINFPSKSWVLCLEVGEHIPAEYEQTFLQNLDRLNRDGIILSWAIRGQGGDGHVNCLDNWEVIERMVNMGYHIDMSDTNRLRNKCAKYPETGWWFRNTLMVFRRNIIETCSQGMELA